ncbi:MAG: FAD:protein FMN transferase [Isosphaeraceae bacterium]
MKRPQTGVNRRDLLRLRRAGCELAEIPSPGGTGATLESADATDLIRVHRPAMGSYFEIRLGARFPGAVELATRALDLIDELEAQLTIYRGDSEVSRLNAIAHEGPVRVEAGLFGLLMRAAELSRETGGAYDVTSGALSEAWGFVRGPKRVPDPEVLADARARTGWQHLTLDPAEKSVSFDRPGITINLGSIGKGYAIDRAVEVIRGHWLPTSALVHGGQSSLFAAGLRRASSAAAGRSRLRNPRILSRRWESSGFGIADWAPPASKAVPEFPGEWPWKRSAAISWIPGRGPRSAGERHGAGPDGRRHRRRPLDGLLSARAGGGRACRRPSGVGIVFVREAAAGGRPDVLTFGLRPEDFRIDPGAVSLMTTP